MSNSNCSFLTRIQVVCYADKFYSKTHLERERSVIEAAQSLEKFGEKGVKRFLEWAHMFE